MIQFETNKKARTHWKFAPIGEKLLKKYINYKSSDMEAMFNEWQEKAILDQEKFLRKKGIKMVLCHMDNVYVLTYCQKNYDGTYHGLFYMSDDMSAKQDFTSCMDSFIKNANKLYNKAAGSLLKKEDVPYNVLKGMN